MRIPTPKVSGVVVVVVVHICNPEVPSQKPERPCLTRKTKDRVLGSLDSVSGSILPTKLPFLNNRRSARNAFCSGFVLAPPVLWPPDGRLLATVMD